MTLPDKQAALVARLRSFRSAPERLAWLVADARQRPALSAAERVPEWRVAGCLSQLWVVGELVEGRCRFRCDSDSLIVKALAGLLGDLASGETPAELLRAEVAFLAAPEFQRLLTSNRQNALSRVWEHLRAFAARHVESVATVPDAPPRP